MICNCDFNFKGFIDIAESLSFKHKTTCEFELRSPSFNDQSSMYMYFCNIIFIPDLKNSPGLLGLDKSPASAIQYLNIHVLFIYKS